MVDLKQFRKVNKLSQNTIAAFLDVSTGFVSHVETGRCPLPEKMADSLINNNRGWVVPEGAAVPETASAYSETAQNWPSIVAALSAKIGEQNSQIDRLLSIVEQLTSQKK